jgi:hypothetical protein
MKGADRPDIQILDLPAFTDGQKIISCWQLNKEDIENIVREGKLYLIVMLPVHPPVWIQTESPFNGIDDNTDNQ